MTLTSIPFLLLLCAAALSMAELNSQLVLVNGATKNFQSETIGKLPVGNATDRASISESNNDVPIINNLQSRDELLNKVSSYDELHKILGRFRNFINISSPNATGNNNGSSSITNLTSVHSGSIVINYSWDLEKTNEGKYSILMLKFTNVLGELPTKRTDYNILIKNGTHILLQKNGTTFTGTDMKTIDLPVAHDIQINVTRFNDKVVNEHIPLPETTIQSPKPQGPVINDPNLKAKVVFKGLNFPTSMAFLGPNDILVLEKNDGTVRRIVNGTMLPHPLIHVNVANEIERGMLGIAVAKNKDMAGNTTTYVFLYYTENKTNPLSNLSAEIEKNQSGNLPLYWYDSLRNCENNFKCTGNFTNGWKDNTSFQISTNTTNKNIWSYINGKEIDVKPGEQYALVTHMKLNKFAVQSHIIIEGYNQTSKKWDLDYQITQCPTGNNGPLEWYEYTCSITIPKDTTKIRPILRAGWSSQPGKEAVSLFDAIYLSKIYPHKTSYANTTSNLILNPELEINSVNNRLYRYELVNNKLVNPKLLLNLPATHFLHNGGKIVIGPDSNVYIVVGNVEEDTKAQNIADSKDPDGSGGILRVTQDGSPIRKGILGDKIPLNLYYAYGIRNSFGMDFDPMTGKLWDTENGAECCDEINLVEPGFNSGWNKVQGIWEPLLKGSALVAGPIEPHPPNLVDFGGKGKYRPPEFTWYGPDVGPTGLKFLNSDKLGRQYKDDMFVGDFHFGNLYHFKLNAQRNGLLLSGPLAGKVAANSTEPAIQSIVFGHGFGGITDVQVGPDGYLYVLSLYAGGDNCDPIHPRPCIQYSSALPGTIFRIAPPDSNPK